jgi:hypothetical protein
MLDPTAAGHGWFIDPTPADDAEFVAQTDSGALLATPSSPADGAMDLLSVVVHEMGHVLGLDSHELLGATLDTGVRSVPSDTATPASNSAPSLEYAIRVLAAERRADEEDEAQDYLIKEISFDSLGAPRA